MYFVTVKESGAEKAIEASGLSIDNGNLIFFKDEECRQVNRVIPSGEWLEIFIDDNSNPLQVGVTHAVQECEAAQVPVQPEAGSGEEVCGAQQEKLHCLEAGVEECAKAQEEQA